MGTCFQKDDQLTGGQLASRPKNIEGVPINSMEESQKLNKKKGLIGLRTDPEWEDKDIGKRNCTLRDRYFKKENNKFPFSRCMILVFQEKVVYAEKACGEQGFLTIEELRVRCPSEAWAELSNSESNIVAWLKHSGFKGKGNKLEENQIDMHTLLAYGMIQCQGKPTSKALAFFNASQDSGHEAHTHISANDKDLKFIFERMCALVTYEFFEFAESRYEVPNKFAADKKRISEAHEDLREDVLLEEVFGKESRMEKEDFINKLAKSSPWIFDSDLLRKAVFKTAGLEYKME